MSANRTVACWGRDAGRQLHRYCGAIREKWPEIRANLAPGATLIEVSHGARKPLTAEFLSRAIGRDLGAEDLAVLGAAKE